MIPTSEIICPFILVHVDLLLSRMCLFSSGNGSCDSGVTNQGSSAATRKTQSGSDRWAQRRHFDKYQTVK